MPAPNLSASNAPPSRRHIAALDGIRGIAITMVMVYHFDTRAILRVINDAGWVGVDLFFVLSGFLITGILFDSKTDSRYFKNFYARRALRIFPLYYAVLGAYTALCIWRQHWNIVRDLAWLWPYLANVHMAITDHWTNQWLDHFWSLAVEEHYYLVWPAIVLWLGRRSLMRVCVGMIVVALALRIVLYTRHDMIEAYFLTPCRMDSLAAGSWLALLVRGPTSTRSLRRGGLIACAITGVMLAAMYRVTNRLSPGDGRVYTIGFTLLGTFSAGLIAMTIADPMSRLSRAFTFAPLRWLGKYSYGLYVVHPIIMRLPTVTRGWPERFAFIPQLVCSLVAAWLIYHLYEKHFLKLKRYFEPAPATRPARPEPAPRPIGAFDALAAKPAESLSIG